MLDKTKGNLYTKRRRYFAMMYPFMTLNDDTEITHSEMKSDGRVKVYIETPDLKDGFHHAACYLPDFNIITKCATLYNFHTHT